NDDDVCNVSQDSKWTNSDDDEIPFFTLQDFGEEEQDVEYGLKDADMTNVKQGGVDLLNDSNESGFMHEENAHVTLITVHDKTEGPLQSSSASSNYTRKLLNLDNTSPAVNAIASLMNTSTVPPPPPPVNPSSHLPIIPQ
nr:hypothetical protein [Tanacetum cinerariifolium]